MLHTTRRSDNVAATLDRPTASGDDSLTAKATSPMRIYAADHQPIRLLAELEGVSAAELVHRAVSDYMRGHSEALTSLAEEARRNVANGDLDGLAEMFRRDLEARRRRRVARLAALRTTQAR